MDTPTEIPAVSLPIPRPTLGRGAYWVDYLVNGHQALALLDSTGSFLTHVEQQDNEPGADTERRAKGVLDMLDRSGATEAPPDLRIVY